MNTTWHQRLTGILFIVGAALVNIPYTLLIMNFDYPDILRESTGHILTRYQEGGTGLIFTWLAFAWVGIPLLFAIVMLKNVGAGRYTLSMKRDCSWSHRRSRTDDWFTPLDICCSGPSEDIH